MAVRSTGNCSSLSNLAFNWRIIMAPDSVLDYLVAHEVVHLAVPDHSHRFWPHEAGTAMRDRVHYALPLGPAGRLAHAALVRRDLERIFDYRATAVTANLG